MVTEAIPPEISPDRVPLTPPATTNLVTPQPESAWSYAVEIGGIAQAFQEFMREFARQDVAGGRQ
jgi:hypothetical protein